MQYAYLLGLTYCARFQREHRLKGIFQRNGSEGQILDPTRKISWAFFQFQRYLCNLGFTRNIMEFSDNTSKHHWWRQDGHQSHHTWRRSRSKWSAQPSFFWRSSGRAFLKIEIFCQGNTYPSAQPRYALFLFSGWTFCPFGRACRQGTLFARCKSLRFCFARDGVQKFVRSDPLCIWPHLGTFWSITGRGRYQRWTPRSCAWWRRFCPEKR